MERRHKALNVREMLITDAVIGLVAPLIGMRLGSAPLLENLVGGQIYAHCIGSLAHVSLMWAYPRIAHWTPVPRWLMVFVILAIDATVGSAAGAVLLAGLGFYAFDHFWRQFQAAYQISMVVTFHVHLRRNRRHHRNAEVKTRMGDTATRASHATRDPSPIVFPRKPHTSALPVQCFELDFVSRARRSGSGRTSH
jgi:hypothetical protein